MIKIDLIVGTRPNLVKAAALWKAAESREVELRLIHTGQHRDPEMFSLLLSELDLPEPDIILKGDHNKEEVVSGLLETWEVLPPDGVMVLGDVNATLYAALAAREAGLPIAHVEAGLRSYDPSMPEENNRIQVDRFADILFVSEESGMVNLIQEGHSKERLHLVGNVMIDTLKGAIDKLPKVGWPDGYVLWTVHRPSNVDRKKDLLTVTELLGEVLNEYPVVLPLHPRTRKSVQIHGLEKEWKQLEDKGLVLTPPMGYHQFISSLRKAKAVVTDSGGVQEEAYYLNVPCITLRPNTERPSTLAGGGNVLMQKEDTKAIIEALSLVELSKRRWAVPDTWDGKAAERIFDILINLSFASLEVGIKSDIN